MVSFGNCWLGAQLRGRNVFASTSYKSRFKLIMNDGHAQGMEQFMEERADIFLNENIRKGFQKFCQK
jgi:hypothetical protein